MATETAPEKDPITSSSLSWPLAISSFLLLVSTVWTVWDEFWGSRPWKGYQSEFVELYRAYLEDYKYDLEIHKEYWAYLKDEKKRQENPEDFEKTEKAVEASQKGPIARAQRKVREGAEYKSLEKDHAAAVAKTKAQVDRINDLLDRVVAPTLDAITPPMQDAKAFDDHLGYEIDEASYHGDEDKRARFEGERKETRKQTRQVGVPSLEIEFGGDKKEVDFESLEGEILDRTLDPNTKVADTTGIATKEYDFDKILLAFDRAKSLRDRFSRELGELTKDATKIQREIDAHLRKKLPGLTEEQIDELLKGLDTFNVEIKQIHVTDVGLVERCESCHVGIRAPVELRAEDMGGKAVYVSHPRPEIFANHDPERFGCSPCHGGNGYATTTIGEGHGKYKHWLWPLHDRANVEAGCLQCHEGALHLDGAATFNAGTELFRHMGCWGCHPRSGFDRETERIKDLTQQLDSLKRLTADYDREIETQKFRASSDALKSVKGEDEKNLIRAESSARQEALGVLKTTNATQALEKELQKRDLEKQKKGIAPNLKVIRGKLKPEWVLQWIWNTKGFRPTTRMPQFRLEEREMEAIAAYVWQNSVEPAGEHAIQDYAPGDAAKGKGLFEQVGCMACHGRRDPNASVKDGEDPWKGVEGGNFAVELSRIGEKAEYDYLVGWILSPSTSGDMNIAAHTVMPSLRLTQEEARDIATYLVSLARTSEELARDKYEYRSRDDALAVLEDPAKASEGANWISHYGCFGCHEIAKFEETGKIGTELTKEGSKPLDQIDFGLLTKDAKAEHWYSHKGFFEKKLENPAVYDWKKEKKRVDQLKMPTFNLSGDERTALVTFLLGSVDSRFPDRMYDDPTGARKDVRDGWWIVQKYNCVGCHPIQAGDRPPIRNLPLFEDATKAPPSLVGEGARVRGDWLAHFLRDPGISKTDGRNRVRPYLGIRMPTFELSDQEIAGLIRFFDGMTAQSLPYLEEPPTPLTDDERSAVRAGFLVGDCLQCHVTSLEKFSEKVIAPSFVVASTRLKPLWTRRWIIDPGQFDPRTRMPSEIFVDKGSKEHPHWVVKKEEQPAALSSYTGDHVDLFVRYIRQIDDAEGAVLAREWDAEVERRAKGR